MASEHAPSTAEKIRKIPWYLMGSAGNAIFAELTVFGSLFVLFLDKLGITSEQMGIVFSFFPFMGVIAVLITPYVAMVGYKRIFLMFYSIRKFILVFILFIPWIDGYIFGYVGVIVAVFAICRAIAETGYYPWNKEFIPDSLRGKYEGQLHVVTIIASLLAVGVSSYVLSISEATSTYVWLFGIGVVVGLFGVWSFSHLPGGTAVSDPALSGWQIPDIRKPFRNPQFAKFVAGVSLVTLVTGPIVSFLPLYLINTVGLGAVVVIQLQIATKVGGLFFSTLWGWAADRYGSKPVMISSIVLIGVLMVLLSGLPFIPFYVYWLVIAAAFWQGVVFVGWQMGFSRLLFNGLITEANKKDSLPVYYAVVGFAGGIGQIAGGWMLNREWGIMFGEIQVHSYQLLLIVGIIVLSISIALLRQVYEEHAVSVHEFFLYWTTGNPLSALDTVFRYGWGADEKKTVSLIRRLGDANSHLTVHELLSALQDPRFQVRYEAINAIARTRHNDKLTRALEQLLAEGDPAMSVATAWALGRIGDEKSIMILRNALDSPYTSVQEQVIRSLTYIKDPSPADAIYIRLTSEKNHAMKLAYIAYLGKVKYRKALPLMLKLYVSCSVFNRREIGLALARIFVVSETYLRQLKKADTDAGTYIALFSVHVHKVLKRYSRVPVEWEHIEGALAFGEWDLARNTLESIRGQVLPDADDVLVADVLFSQLKRHPEEVSIWVLLLCLVKASAK